MFLKRVLLLKSAKRGAARAHSAAAVSGSSVAFTHESATAKVRAAEDAWNSRDPEKVALAYAPDSRWRNRTTFVTGRPAIVEFLRGKWGYELDYRLCKELWATEGNRIAVRFVYEYHDAAGQWHRAYGNEMWEFGDEGNGLMTARHASITEMPISENDRRFHWDARGPRPAGHPGLTEMGL